MPNVIVRSLALALLVGLSSSPIDAGGFIINKSDWDTMSGVEKQGYVMGSYDSMMLESLGDSLVGYYLKDLEVCAMELKLNSTLMIELVDLEYQDVSNWGLAPNVVMRIGLRKACQTRIDGYRAQRGELTIE